jgi:nucleoside-diphosphate-sugar epimerase
MKNDIARPDPIISKAIHELGYEPKVGLEEGLRTTLKWYKENGYL